MVYPFLLLCNHNIYYKMRLAQANFRLKSRISITHLYLCKHFPKYKTNDRQQHYPVYYA